MAVNRQEVTKWLEAARPGSELDAVLLRAGFSSRRNAITYVRPGVNVSQRVRVFFDLAPRYEPGAVAHMLPQVVIESENLAASVLKMMPQGPQYDPTTAAIILRIQFQNLSPKGEEHNQACRWFVYNASDVPGLLSQMGQFAEAHAVPFLDSYRDVKALTLGYEEGDERLRSDRRFYLYVAAAFLNVGHPEKAMRVLEVEFGRPAMRKQYAAAFDFVRNWQPV